ncbi:hypothetical protein [Metabacillus niabensis]|uniref:hypothetical protein n=1 Tax=Metabacillus niabensis TaxID=324854 RepID=UPI0039A349F3
MKIEIEVKAFGKDEVQGTLVAYKSNELMRVHNLSDKTTIAEVETLLEALFEEVERGFINPEQCVGKITIRAKKENGEIKYLG